MGGMSDSASINGSDDEPQTPQTVRTASSSTNSPVRSPGSSVDNVADLAARRRALEEKYNDDDSDGDDVHIYAQMRQRMLGGGDVSAPKPSEAKQTKAASPASRPSKSPKHNLSKASSDRESDADSDSDVPVIGRNRPRPSGMFVTSDDSASDKESDIDTLPEPTHNKRLQQLIQQRRKERLETETLAAEESEQRTKSELEDSSLSSALPSEVRISDDDLEQPVADKALEDRLTQQARPTRKASKKAIEEMNKETQRMNRNMQLTHQAKVKTKFSIADFTARFAAKAGSAQVMDVSAAPSSSMHPSSDVEGEEGAETPPSSPPSETASPNLGKSIFSSRTTAPEQVDEDMPSLEDILAQTLAKPNKGKAPEVALPETFDPEPKPPKKKLSPRTYRVMPLKVSRADKAGDSSDDDLDVVRDKLAIFDEVQPRKATESRAFQHLRYLANMNQHESAGRHANTTPTITSAQLDEQLRKRAALQARQERDEKVAALRARGIVVLTAEERERDQMEVENLLEKARTEAEELRKKEKAQAKADGNEMDLVASDDESEDEEWQESPQSDVDELADLDDSEEEDEEAGLSGSDNDDADDEGEDDDIENETGLVDDAAEESDDATEVAELEGEVLEQTPTNVTRKAGRKRLVIEDDEDDDMEDTQPLAAIADAVITEECAESRKQPTSSADDVAAAFGFADAPPALMSPAQMFAGTMGASQSQYDVGSPTQEQDSMDLFRRIVPSELSQTPATPSAGLRSNSIQDTPSAIRLLEIQTQTTPHMTTMSQYSIPTPSQDAGLGQIQRGLYRDDSIGPQSTVDTVDTILVTVPESPIQPRRGRLQRRRLIDEESVADQDEEVAASERGHTTTAFDVMRKAASKPAEQTFDKTKSEAKNMVVDQAEESEDEYAGLGGLSDDEDEGEADEMDRQMIDESDVKVDERKMAAFYAEKTRVENEAQTSKLYKDLMSGALRRQRGDAFDLDSDEDDQLAERRRRKQREEARKRRLLLGDENLGKFDGNDKKEAFLRAIEDRDEADDEVDMLDGKDRDADEVVPDSQPNASQQSQSQSQQGDTLQEITGNALKRKAAAPVYDGPFKRPSLAGLPRPGRTANAAFLKPSSLAEVRASVSFLVDEPHAEPSSLEIDEYESDGGFTEDGQDAEQIVTVERPHYSARRTPTVVPTEAIDRLLLRKTSSTISTSDGSVAFVARSTTVMGSFRGHSLLKRATSSALSAGKPGLRREGSSASTSSTSDAGIRRSAGGNKSSIAYAAREAERRAVLDGVERRRKADVKRIAGMRRGVGLASMNGGGFE